MSVGSGKFSHVPSVIIILSHWSAGRYLPRGQQGLFPQVQNSAEGDEGRVERRASNDNLRHSVCSADIHLSGIERRSGPSGRRVESDSRGESSSVSTKDTSR